MTTHTEKQMWAVQALEIPPWPPEAHEVTKYSVEDLGRYVLVTRKYVPVHARRVEYFEIFQIGPGGSVKKMHSSIGF